MSGLGFEDAGGGRPSVGIDENLPYDDDYNGGVEYDDYRDDQGAQVCVPVAVCPVHVPLPTRAVVG